MIQSSLSENLAVVLILKYFLDNLMEYQSIFNNSYFNLILVLNS